ncbi:proline--tRNA ligase, partial [archaeon]
MAEQEGITAKKAENFSEWYTQVVQKAQLADYGPVQGTIAFRPNSYAIWENMQKIFDARLKSLGVKNTYFPQLIPESLLKKEADNFKGFAPEVFWVTHSGDNKMGEKLAIRPTSETIMYSFYAKWIRSWRDLPLMLNQWCNVNRAEITSTKPFIRTSEFLWQEGHTAHETHEEAEKMVMQIINEYKVFVENYLAIPVIAGKKTDAEKFAGAVATTAIEAMMPDGKALQCGTSHDLGQNFSKPFNVRFLDKNEKEQFVWQTSWGITTRLIGALIMTHGDDKGLVVPPKIAQTQIVIVPIYYKEADRKNVMSTVKDVVTGLQMQGFSVHVDDRDGYTPGWKFNEWEMQGIPLRIEIGPKDVAAKQVVAVRRDNGEKIKVPQKELSAQVLNILNDMQKNLFEKAGKFLKESITAAKSYEEFKKTIKGKGGFV